MKETKIVIDIDAEGTLSLEASGFESDACLDQIAKVLDGLASAPQKVDRKAAEPPQRVAKAQQIGSKK